MEKKRKGKGCSVCARMRDNPHRSYCLACHARYMREWRKTHPLSPEQAKKMRARAYANMYLRRGKITRSACSKCGSPKSQMHHLDYSKPLSITWLCRPCNIKAHKILKEKMKHESTIC